MRFSTIEKKDLAFAGFMISLAFAILLAGGYRAVFSGEQALVIAFVIAFFTAGIGFLLHEVMHKYVAQSYGLAAEFRAFYGMLWLSLLFAMFGFIIAAPGAVFIGGRNITREKNGKISVAGPWTNIVLAILFLGMLLIVGSEGVLGEIANYGLAINALLGAFNMIPVMPFDGAKVLAWNKGIYAATTIVAVGLVILGFVL